VVSTQWVHNEIILLDYQAPEVFDESCGHDTEVDQWAVGVILYELYLGNRCSPFRYNHRVVPPGFDRDPKMSVSIIEERIINLNKNTPIPLPMEEAFDRAPDLLDLIKKLLVHDPKKYVTTTCF
jgi:serine/threonine protein kinase